MKLSFFLCFTFIPNSFLSFKKMEKKGRQHGMLIDAVNKERKFLKEVYMEKIEEVRKEDKEIIDDFNYMQNKIIRIKRLINNIILKIYKNNELKKELKKHMEKICETVPSSPILTSVSCQINTDPKEVSNTIKKLQIKKQLNKLNNKNNKLKEEFIEQIQQMSKDRFSFIFLKGIFGKNATDINFMTEKMISNPLLLKKKWYIS